MKVELAQIRTDAANISGNSEAIKHYYGEARDSADLVVFPELSVPGYMSLDYFKKSGFVKESEEAVKELAKMTKETGAIVGYVREDKSLRNGDGSPVRYNSLALLADGEVKAVVDKTLLPEYDVFFENRYFKSGNNTQPIPFRGINLGLEICEDLWDESYSTKVSEQLVNNGADVIINISASPFYVDKSADREKLVSKQARMLRRPILYANIVGAQDGYEGELVFDGTSLVSNKSGEIVQKGAFCQEDSLIFELIRNERGILDILADHKYYQMSPTEQLRKSLVTGISDYFRRTGFKQAVIGLSGGIDSAVVAALAVEAIGKENVLGVGLPSKFSSEGSITDARDLADNLAIPFQLIPIGETFDAITHTLAPSFEGKSVDVTEENFQARIRGIILMGISNKFGRMVLSTGNKTETALGYSTLYGDMCGGLAPISDVSKLRVYDLAKHFNSTSLREVIPYNTIYKPPSAELSEGQTDENSLGGGYAIISPLVDDVVEHEMPYEELLKKYPQSIVDRVLLLTHRSEYKRRQAPPGIKVTRKSFGVGRRYPVAHGRSLV